MAKTKKIKPQITQGGINIKGNVTIKNSKIAGRDNVEKKVVNVNLSFAPVYHALNESATISPETKKTVEENVKQIEKEVKKGNKANSSFIQQRLENIQRMAPDIAEVVIATLQNPAAGIGLTVRKVINKIQAKKAT
jgi:DNA topoisomerase VI subunit B